MPVGHCTVVKEATGNISLKLRGGVRIGDKNLEVITIKIQAKNRNKTTQGVTEREKAGRIESWGNYNSRGQEGEMQPSTGDGGRK